MPYRFELYDPEAGVTVFVEIINTCTHHYTGEKMRFVREHWVTGSKHDIAHCTYKFLNEATWQKYLDHRVIDNAAHTGDQ